MCLALVTWIAPPAPVRAVDPFDLIEVRGRGRTVAAELADVNGDGLTDLVQIAFVGHPPQESRWIRVYLQRAAEGARTRLPPTPSAVWPLPHAVSAYDFADLDETPGEELLLLHPAGVLVLSLAGPDLVQRTIDVPDPPTLGAAPDERGLDRIRLAQPGPDGTTWLFVPQPTRTVALSPSGEVRARLDVRARANYLVQRSPGPLMFDSEIQLFMDLPRLTHGDVDGDGRRDMVASSRHYLRVFLQRPDGSFPYGADRVLPLARVSELDHIRGAGAVRVDVTDIDGDDRVDVLVSHASGGFSDAHTQTAIHLNRKGDWDLRVADQVFETTGAWTSVQLLDLDGDGRRELVRIGVPLSILELVELLVTRAVDAELLVHRPDGKGLFEETPSLRRKLDVPLSFDTYQPIGFVPTLQSDVNGDGHNDLLASASGGHIEVFLGGPDHRLGKSVARQEVDSRGRIHFGDLDGDGLTDLLLFDPRSPDAPVRIARNGGHLPGSPVPTPVLAPAPVGTGAP